MFTPIVLGPVEATVRRRIGILMSLSWFLASCGGSGTNLPTVQTVQLAVLGPPPQVLGDGFPGLVAADATTVLYEKSDGGVYRNSGGNEVKIGGGSTYDSFVAILWFASSGYYAQQVEPADGSDSMTIYDPNGSSSNVPLPGVGIGGRVDNFIWPWLLYHGAGQGYVTLINAQSGESIAVGSGMDVSAADFFVSGGEVTVYFIANGTVYRWNQSSDESVAVATTRGIVPGQLRTDGERVAWDDTNSGCPCIFALHSLDISQNAVTDLSQDERGGFAIADGTLAWIEGSSGSGAVKTFDGTSISTLESTATTLYGTSLGSVLFANNSKLIAQGAHGGQIVVDDAVPTSALIVGNVVYYVTGPTNILYRATLN
jgi:hypothetical protein